MCIEGIMIICRGKTARNPTMKNTRISIYKQHVFIYDIIFLYFSLAMSHGVKYRELGESYINNQLWREVLIRYNWRERKDLAKRRRER